MTIPNSNTNPHPGQTPSSTGPTNTTKPFVRFAVLWSGQFVSSIGSGLTAFGLSTYLFQTTGSATAVAAVTLCAFLPPVVLAPLAGMLADRYDRRLLMIAADGLSILGLAYILVTVMTGQSSPLHIYAGVIFSAFFVSLLDPSYRASITDLLTQDQYAKASGMVQLAGSSKYLISPVIAGFLYPWCGITGLLLIDIGTFALTAITTLAVRRQLAHDDRAVHPVPSRGRWWTDFIDGFRSLYTQPGVLTIVAIMAVATFCIGFLETLFPPLMLSFTTPQTLGVVETIAASGMLAGSLIISTINTTTRYTREMLIGLGLTGLFIIAVGIVPNAIIIAAAGFCFFACLPFVNTPAEVLIRTAIPNQTQGRTWGLISLLSNLGYIIAYSISGVLADHVFTPLLLNNGVLASTIGRVIGIGPGRGIGLMIIIVGLMLALAAALLTYSRTLKMMMSRIQRPEEGQL